MPTPKDFEELAIFQMARELSKRIYQPTLRGDFKHDSRFVQQIRAAAGSIMDNIAEGFERNGNKEFINFLYIAKGSCGEVRSQLIRANDVGYLTTGEFNQLYTDCRKLSAGIMKFINELKSSDMSGAKYKPLNS
ncbi:MAG: four helix bundle protein [Prevotella sp.]|nr:four helix bundle protein [Prevotella sp.]